MQKYVVKLTDEPYESGFSPSISAYILDKDESGAHPAIIICPGGGYGFVFDNWEGERIAMAYLAVGFNAIVLDYTVVSKGNHPQPIREIAQAIKYCRLKAEEWNINPKQIAVCGFSAGGHLAASISTLWNSKEIFTREEIESELHKPNASVLCYPVITSGEFAHKDSFKNLTGTEDESSNLWELLSLEKQVNDATVPAFLWHTFEDDAVPAENSMLYASALRKHNIPFELHIYQKGGHGLSLSTQNIARNKSALKRDYMWHKLSVDWLQQFFGII